MSEVINKQSKTKELELALIHEIKNNFIKAHSLFYSEREVIEKYNLHRTTVRQVLKSLTDLGYLYRINGKGTFVAPTAKIKQILVVQKVKEHLLESGSYGQIEFNDGLSKIIQHDDLPYVTIKIDFQTFLEKFDELELIYKNLCGIIFYSNISLLKVTKDALESMNIPFMFFGSDVNVHNLKIPFISYNQKEVVSLGLEYLYKMGHRGIGFVYTSDSAIRNQRLDEYKLWMKNKSLEIEDNFIIDLSFHLGIDREIKYNEIQEQLKSLLPIKNLTAVLCADDLVALYFINSSIRLGVQIPKEISVVGINNYPICPDIIIPLTSVAIPFFHGGEESIKMIDCLINKKRSNNINSSIISNVVERESVVNINK